VWLHPDLAVKVDKDGSSVQPNRHRGKSTPEFALIGLARSWLWCDCGEPEQPRAYSMHVYLQIAIFSSGGTRIRTGDTMIFSHVLYQLSYPAEDGVSGLSKGFRLFPPRP
jgi:hypothetical protein